MEDSDGCDEVLFVESGDEEAMLNFTVARNLSMIVVCFPCKHFSGRACGVK